MKKFKFAALALVGVGALGCSGHKITMKSIDLEPGIERLQGIAAYEGDYELPENFKFSFTYYTSEKMFVKDSQSLAMEETESQTLEFLYDLKNLRGCVTTKEDLEEKSGSGSYATESIIRKRYIFFKDNYIHTIEDDGTGYFYEQFEPTEATEEEAKAYMKKEGSKGFRTPTKYAITITAAFMNIDLNKEELGKDAVVNNKYGSDDEKSFQILSNCKFSAKDMPVASNDSIFEGDVNADVFGEIKDYHITNSDLSLNMKIDYSADTNEKVTGAIEMAMKASSKLEEGKGGFSIPTYTEYVKPEVR